MIAILDYDAGNIKSVEKALNHLGQETILTRDFHEILRADKVILPGVGSFGDAMAHLKKYELDRAIREVVAEKKPFLGICLGLQLLFPSEERLFSGISERAYVYFVHSYYLQAEDPSIVKATCQYGVQIHASVEKDNVFACQFHPEKSGEVGLAILQNFADL